MQHKGYEILSTFYLEFHYIRQVISDKEDPFETPEIDTIIILAKKKLYI
jgi:hypothetical protein